MVGGAGWVVTPADVIAGLRGFVAEAERRAQTVEVELARLRRRAEIAEAQAAACLSELRSLEWAGGDACGTPVCPSCCADKYQRDAFGNDVAPIHKPDCILAALLAEPKP